MARLPHRCGTSSIDLLCRYLHHRLRAMAKSMLVTEIFIRATQARIGTGDDSAALTLMSTDIERIDMGFVPIHEIWASIIQAGLAGWMLYNQLGIVFVAPMGVVIACFLGLMILMRFTGDSQRAWMAGVQKRVGLTATVIANMKNLKISGLTGAVKDFIQMLRVQELAAGARFRKIMIIAAVFGYIPLLLSPPLTFAFAQKTMDVTRMFTSLSYLLLLTNPLSEIFQVIPQFLSALACLGRVQAFLECETRDDYRKVLNDIRRDANKTHLSESGTANTSVYPIVVKNGNFGWDDERYTLRNVNTQVAKSSLTIVIGPVGSGKSTFCKALLGEIPFRDGTVALSTRFAHVGFCDQTAFLSNGSIRDNIVGFSPFDSDRYTEVIRATALGVDLDTLPQGDKTNIGSDGISLSGGQKQRVSLARALYLQTDILILDDVFSGLDADTEEQVFRNVFGPDGLLRRRHSTVILCTHSIRHLPSADYIIALGNGTVAEQGSFNQLMSRPGYVQGLGLKCSSESDIASEPTNPSQAGSEAKFLPLNATATNVSSIAPDTDSSRQTGDKTVYRHYFKSMGWMLAAWSLLFAILWGFFTNIPTICKHIYKKPIHIKVYYSHVQYRAQVLV